MKKFLSLILSLVLAMSLVTVNAGAVGTAVSTQRASPLDKYIGKFIRVFNAAIQNMGPYTVLCTTNAKGQTCLQFGKDLDAAARKDMLAKLNGSGLGKRAFIPETAASPEATEAQIRAWKGEGEEPVDREEIAAPTAADVTAAKSYEIGGAIAAGDFTLDAGKGTVTGVSPTTAAGGLEKVTVTVAAPEGKKYPGDRRTVAIEVAVTVNPAAPSGVDNTDTSKLNAATWDEGNVWTEEPKGINLKWYKEKHRDYLSDDEATRIVNESLPTKGPFTVTYDERGDAWSAARTVDGVREDVEITVTRYYKVRVNGTPLVIDGIEGISENFKGSIDGVAAGVYIQSGSDYVLKKDLETDGYSAGADGLKVNMKDADIKEDLDLVDAVVLQHNLGELHDKTKHHVMIGGVEITDGSYVRSGAVVTVMAPEKANKMTGFSAKGKDTAYFDPTGGPVLGGDPESKDVTGTYEVLKANEDENFTITLAAVNGIKVVVEGVSAQPVGLFDASGYSEVLTDYDVIRKYYVAVRPTVTGDSGDEGSAWGKYDDNNAGKTTVLQGVEQISGREVVGKFTLGTNMVAQAVKGVLTLVPAVEIDATTDKKIDSAETKMAHIGGKVNPVKVDTEAISHVAIGTSIQITTKAPGEGGPSIGQGIFADVLKAGGTRLGVVPGGAKDSNIVANDTRAVGFFEATEANLKNAAGKAVDKVTFCVKDIPLGT